MSPRQQQLLSEAPLKRHASAEFGKGRQHFKTILKKVTVNKASLLLCVSVKVVLA